MCDQHIYAVVAGNFPRRPRCDQRVSMDGYDMVNQSFASVGRIGTAVMLLLAALAAGRAEASKSDNWDSRACPTRIQSMTASSVMTGMTMPMPKPDGRLAKRRSFHAEI